MKNTIIILLVISLFTVYGCPDKDEVCQQSISIRNNSNEVISSLVILKNESCQLPLSFPQSFKGDNIDSWTVNPFSEKDIFCSSIIDTSQEVCIYVFNKDTLLNLSWDIVVERGAYSKTFEMSLSDLENLGWFLTYP